MASREGISGDFDQVRDETAPQILSFPVNRIRSRPHGQVIQGATYVSNSLSIDDQQMAIEMNMRKPRLNEDKVYHLLAVFRRQLIETHRRF